MKDVVIQIFKFRVYDKTGCLSIITLYSGWRYYRIITNVEVEGGSNVFWFPKKRLTRMALEYLLKIHYNYLGYCKDQFMTEKDAFELISGRLRSMLKIDSEVMKVYEKSYKINEYGER